MFSEAGLVYATMPRQIFSLWFLSSHKWDSGRTGREVGDLSLCSGVTGTEHRPEKGFRVYVVLDAEDPDTVPGTLIPTSIIIGGNKGVPCGTDQGNTVPWGFVFLCSLEYCHSGRGTRKG